MVEDESGCGLKMENRSGGAGGVVFIRRDFGGPT